MEEGVKNIFEWYRDSIDGAITHSLAAAEECDAEGSLENFYTAASTLRGLGAVFTERVPEVEEYVERTNRRMKDEVIPSLAEKIGVCRAKE